MNDEITVTLTYSEEEAREVARVLLYFDSNVTATYKDHDRMNLIRSAIKAALPPPKPDEPLGLGAVVEDAKGQQWVRSGKSYRDPNWRICGGSDWTRYVDIKAVRILSAGVES